jgi:hypothetical protein
MSYELEASSSSSFDDSTIIRSLETALGSFGINVPNGSIQQLLDKQEWIYPSKRVEDLREVLSNQQLYSVFDYQHHLRSTLRLIQTEKENIGCLWPQGARKDSVSLLCL